MNMPTRVRVGGASEILPYIPYLVGMLPRDCLVLVASSGRVTQGAMRMDLPPGDADPDAVAGGILSALGLLMRLPDVTGVMPVVYTSERFCDDGRVAHADLVMVVMQKAAAHGLVIDDAFCVAADGWGSYIDDDGSWQGRDLAEIAAPAKFVGGPALMDREKETTLPRARLYETEQFARRYAALCGQTWSAVMCGMEPDATAAFEDTALRTDLVLFAEHCLAQAARLPSADLAALGSVLRIPAFRDIILYSWAWGPRIGSHIRMRSFFPEDCDGDSSEDRWMVALAGTIPDRPDPERMRSAIRLLKRLASLLPQSERAPTYTLICWLYWSLGINSVASDWLSRVAEVDERYGLAEIMAKMLAAGHMPDWAFTAEADGSAGDVVA